MERFETQVDRAVASNPEIEELVRRLESEQADEAELEAQDVPSGDTIAQDFQRFLRQRADGDDCRSARCGVVPLSPSVRVRAVFGWVGGGQPPWHANLTCARPGDR